MKQIWSSFSSPQNPESTRWIFLADSPRNVNRSTDERIGDDMAEKVEARMLAGASLRSLSSAISQSLTVKTHFGSNLRLRDNSGKIVGRVTNGSSVTFLGETKITNDSHGQSRDTDGDGSLSNRHLWFKVRTGAGATGWISAEYLQGNLTQTERPEPITETICKNGYKTIVNKETGETIETTSEPCGETEQKCIDGALWLVYKETGIKKEKISNTCEGIITDPPPPVIDRPDPEPEPLPDTVDFSRLPGAISQALNVKTTNRRILAQDFVDTNNRVERGTTNLEAQALSQPENLTFRKQQELISELAKETGLKPVVVAETLNDLGLNPGATHEDVLQKLGLIEGRGSLSNEMKTVLEGLQRVPEAGQLLAPFRHPNVIRALRSSAVLGGALIHTSLWRGITDLSFSGFDESGYMPRTGNSVVDTAAYFVPFAGNLYDFDEGWQSLKQGKIGWAAFNFATGTAGMVLDVFSVVTAPTGVGPVAGQSARMGLKAAARGIKLSIKSGIVSQTAKQVLNGASEYVPNIVKDGARGVGNITRTVADGLGWARGKVLSRPDAWIRSVEESATASLANVRNADTGPLSKVGSSLAYAGKETLSSFYNIITLKFIGTPNNLNAAFDATRADQHRTENPREAEINGVKFKKNQILKVEQDGAAPINVKIEKIQVSEDGKVTVTGKNIETGESVKFDSETPGLKITPETKEQKYERLGKNTAERITALKERYREVKAKIAKQKTKFSQSIKDLIRRFPTKKANAKKIEAEYNKSVNKLETNISKSENRIKAIEEKINNMRFDLLGLRKRNQERKLTNETKQLETYWEKYESIETKFEAKRAELEKSDPAKPAPKTRKPREIPDELDTKLPSAIFSNRGGIGHLRTSKLEDGKTKTVNRTRDQKMQLQTSEDKSAGIRLVSTEKGMDIQYLRGYKGPRDFTEITPALGAQFKVDDSTIIHIKVELTAEGQKVHITREAA